MSVSCVVQARARSSRLPGKVLAEVGGVPMLALLLRRLAPLRPEHLVVATTTDGADDPIEELARSEGAEVVRGPGQDVLARFALALERFPAESVVRITADCPFADAALVEAALALRAETGADYVSNTLVRTFPDGLDVEVLAADALRAAEAEADDPVEREHVTPYVYRRPERFTLRSLRHRECLGHLRWTVDTAEDLDRVRGIAERAGRPDFPWEEGLSLDEAFRPAEGWSLRPATPDDSEVVLSLRNDPAAVRWSRSGSAVEPGEHAEWFARVLEGPGSRLWVARDGGDPIGQVRIDVEDGVGEVSIGVEAGRRGQGVGRWLLDRLEAALEQDEQAHTLTAEVHRENKASLQLFRGAGFAERSEGGDYLVMRRERRSAPR